MKITRIADGEIITRPGAYRMSLDWYHSQSCAGPSTSSSELRTLFSDSPAHAWEESSLNTAKREQEDEEETKLAEKKSYILGRAAHHLLLGEDDFQTAFIVRPLEIDDKPWNGNRTVCKEWLRVQAKAGRTVLTDKNIEQIRGMAHALAAHPLVKMGILEGEIEVSLVWRDERTGLWLKSRPDAIPTSSGDFGDLKGTSFYAYDLDRQAENCRYDMQAALAKLGCKEVLGLDLESFSLVFASFRPPHCVDVLEIHQKDIEAAGRDLRVAIDTLAWCLEHDNWFGPSGTQRDARPVFFSDRMREEAARRREFLQREIAKAEIVDEQARASDRLAAG